MKRFSIGIMILLIYSCSSIDFAKLKDISIENVIEVDEKGFEPIVFNCIYFFMEPETITYKIEIYTKSEVILEMKYSTINGPISKRYFSKLPLDYLNHLLLRLESEIEEKINTKDASDTPWTTEYFFLEAKLMEPIEQTRNVKLIYYNRPIDPMVRKIMAELVIELTRLSWMEIL